MLTQALESHSHPKFNGGVGVELSFPSRLWLHLQYDILSCFSFLIPLLFFSILIWQQISMTRTHFRGKTSQWRTGNNKENSPQETVRSQATDHCKQTSRKTPAADAGLSTSTNTQQVQKLQLQHNKANGEAKQLRSRYPINIDTVLWCDKLSCRGTGCCQMGQECLWYSVREIGT